MKKANCPAMSRRKSFFGSPLKKANSMGVKKDEYTAQSSMNWVHNWYHLHHIVRQSLTASYRNTITGLTA